ncbi:MAG: argininosuccinate lyase [Firmicutes bacterium]|nr:argininosuccinate lyase [Bacillota bacterium]
MKLWSGRFTKPSNSLSNDFNASIDTDQRMWKQDIKGSIAHAKMLAKQGILSAADTELIISGLESIYSDLEAGSIDLSPEKYEDIHMAVEEILTERIGEAGKRLHTARSRNDQVATDFRLFVMDAIDETEENIAVLMESLAIKAKEYETAVMPGFTHLQKAQPVLLSHHLLAYHNMFSRDMDRFEDCKKRTDCMPLGSGALAGTSYDTDREYLASELGFSEICSNSMDAVSDRDFAIEFLSCASQCMMHLSRFCEEIIFWNTSDVGFIEIDDAFATGSSIMPQKKNPDMAELIRGKTGRVYGDLMALLTAMKGLPLAYNKDMQEDKEPVFDAFDTLNDCLKVFTGMLDTLKFKNEKMAKSTKTGYMNATDCADYLVKKGLPFRECHAVIGKLVLDCIEKGFAIEDLSIGELKQYSPLFEEDLYEKISPEACIASKISEGSTSFESVKKQLEKIGK